MFVVLGQQGEYSDRMVWVHRVVADEPSARLAVELASRVAIERAAKMRADDEWMGPFEWNHEGDPNGPKDSYCMDAPTYYYEEAPND